MEARKNGSAVCVLGAGLMGCCLALELAQRGCRVDLFDLADRPMTGASLHNEGKLHLGFVYAKDPRRKTHQLMVQGSLSFTRILERLTGEGPETFERSEPFHYFVPGDSQLGLAAIEEHFHRVEAALHERIRETGERYLGLRVERWFQRNESSEHERLFAPAHTLGSFRTEERSVSTEAVAALLRRTVADSEAVNFIGGTTVRSADRCGDGSVVIETSDDRGTGSRRYACAANCLWDDKVRLDRTAGISEPGPWLFRYKATITFDAPARADRYIPSATGILGPYGDSVHHADGSYYLSWYPLCRRGQSSHPDGRRLHDRVHGLLARCVRKVTSSHPELAAGVAALVHRPFIKANVRRMATYIPSLSGLLGCAARARLGGGVILARGLQDIDDPDSLLHQRSKIGPQVHGSYVTVDTGKYCMAPLFAVETADRVMEILR